MPNKNNYPNFSMLHCFVLALVVWAMGTSASYGQMPLPPSPPTSAPPVYTQEQLEQLLAPIALYPDPLLAQILTAATYPQEVVEADRWLGAPENAALKGDILSQALMSQPWAPSVKSLVPFPSILHMMDTNLQWTEQLGDAFLANQASVMDNVQHLRQRAQAMGALSSTPQQTVTTQDGSVLIDPANPQSTYIPYYNPYQAYGTWPYPSYPPYYFPPPQSYIAYNAGLVSFGPAVAIIGSYWGWQHWNWSHHRLDIDEARFRHINNNRPSVVPQMWAHDTEHRRGVPYYSAPVRAQYERAPKEEHQSYRGYNSAPAQMPQHKDEHTSPVFESFQHGSAARSEAARGVYSRSAPISLDNHTNAGHVNNGMYGGGMHPTHVQNAGEHGGGHPGGGGRSGDNSGGHR